MDPIVTRWEPLCLAGVSATLPPRSAPPAERPRTIQELWRAFMPKVSEIGNRQGAERYSVIENDVTETGEAPVFHAMVAVDSFDGLPDWCVRFTIQPGRYAVFEHKGLPRALSKTVAGIYATWSSRIPALFQHNLEIMMYPQGYDASSPDATCEYWLPLP